MTSWWRVYVSRGRLPWKIGFKFFFSTIFHLILKMISRIPSLGSLFSTFAISLNSSLQWKILQNSRKLKSSQGKAILIFLGRRRKIVKSILRSDAKMFIITIELCGRYLISEFREEKTPKLERLTRQKESLRCSPHLHLARLSHVLKTETSLFFLKTHY